MLGLVHVGASLRACSCTCAADAQMHGTAYPCRLDLFASLTRPMLPLLLHCYCSCYAEEVVRALALCLFDYNEKDLAAFLQHKRKQKQYANMNDQQILNSLPLSALRRHVRRHYISSEKQAERLLAWFAKYMSDALVAIDPVTGRHIVSGPFEAFKTVFGN